MITIGFTDISNLYGMPGSIPAFSNKETEYLRDLSNIYEEWSYNLNLALFIWNLCSFLYAKFLYPTPERTLSVSICVKYLSYRKMLLSCKTWLTPTSLKFSKAQWTRYCWHHQLPSLLISVATIEENGRNERQILPSGALNQVGMTFRESWRA